MQKLISQIEITRRELVDTGISLGLSHPKTVQLSTLLDQLLNQFETLSK